MLYDDINTYCINHKIKRKRRRYSECRINNVDFNLCTKNCFDKSMLLNTQVVNYDRGRRN